MNQIDVLKWLSKKPKRLVPRGRIGGVREKYFNELCVLGQASWAIDRDGTWVWITPAGRERMKETR